MAEWLLIAAAIAAGLFAGLGAWPHFRDARRRARLNDARRAFHRYRERLEAKFVQLAAHRPTMPRWADCQFDDDVAYVRNRTTGQLAAFVGVALAPDEPAEYREEHPSPSDENLRAGTAVFRFDGRHWDTEGVAILNLSPDEAVQFYARELEVVAQELLS